MMLTEQRSRNLDFLKRKKDSLPSWNTCSILQYLLILIVHLKLLLFSYYFSPFFIIYTIDTFFLPVTSFYLCLSSFLYLSGLRFFLFLLYHYILLGTSFHIYTISVCNSSCSPFLPLFLHMSASFFHNNPHGTGKRMPQSKPCQVER